MSHHRASQTRRTSFVKTARRMPVRGLTLVGLSLALGACGGPSEEEETARSEDSVTAPSSLGATLSDPILLTVSAARPRSHYFVDEGYTLRGGDDDALRFTTDDAGDMVLAFEVDGRAVVRGRDLARPVEIVHTAGDALVFRFGITQDVAVDATFAATTSRVATLELRASNRSTAPHRVRAVVTMRKCDTAGYIAPARSHDAVFATHVVPPPFGNSAESILATLVTPRPYVLTRRDALVSDGADDALTTDNATIFGCGKDAAGDAERLLRGGEKLSEGSPIVAALALGQTREIGARGSTMFQFRRGVVDDAAQWGRSDAKTGTLAAEIDIARAVPMAQLLAEGRARLARIPKLAGATRDEALVHRSAFVLLDSLMLRAPQDEGGWIAEHSRIRRPYYLFAREPSWWFSSFGQNLHESLTTPLYAQMDPAAAIASQRVFLDAEAEKKDGFLAYTVGPLVDMSRDGTIAAAPLFSFEASELISAADAAGDTTFAREAYEAGVRIHKFWETRRDRDGNGLVEWGEPGKPVAMLSGAQTESLRDVHNVIWEQVIGGGGLLNKLGALSAPLEVDALDGNVMLVVEEKSLAKLADRVGKKSEASAWRALAAERAARINRAMWDEETGFYYHVAKRSKVEDGAPLPPDRFTYKKPGDLRRKEIQGFLPLWAGIVPEERKARLFATLQSEFLRNGGVTSVSTRDSFYKAHAGECCSWNGPVWVPWNFLVARGLRESGRPDLAHEVTVRVTEAVTEQLRRTHQFRELYNPDDLRAENRSMGNYNWSALVAMMIQEDKKP